jgi:hypothetical protein
MPHYMLIEVTVFDAGGHLIKFHTIDTESPHLMLDQLEQISPVGGWRTLEYSQWRNGENCKRIHHGFIYRSMADNNETDKPQISQQLEYMRRNWATDLEKSRADFGTLDIHQKNNPYLIR